MTTRRQHLFRDSRAVFRLRWISNTLLCAGLALAAHAAQAADELTSWRNEIARVRNLAENDAPRAYAEAQRLQAAQPAQATPADQALALNLLARTELYLALTDQTAQHAEQAMAIASAANDAVGQAESDLTIALNSVNQGDINKLIKVTTHSLSVLHGVDRSDLLGEALLRTSVMYRRIGKLEESVTMALQAMEIAKRSRNALMLTYAHQGMGIALDQSDRAGEALEHYLAMREQAQAAHSKLLEAYALSGIAYMTARVDSAGNAEHLMRQAIALYREVGTPFNINFGLYGLTDFLRKEGRFAEALPLLDEIAASYVKYPNRIGEWYTLNARSDTYEAMGRHADAIADAQRAYELAKSVGFWLYISESQRRLAAFAAKTGDYAEAYHLATDAAETKTKAQQEMVNTRMGEVAQRYEEESRQREIVELTHRNEQQQAELQRHVLQQRWMWTVLGSSVLMLLSSVVFVVRLRRSNRLFREANLELKQSRNEQQRQNELLQSVLNSMAEAVVVIDDHAQLVLANPASATYFGTESIAGDLKEVMEQSTYYLPDMHTPYPRKELPLLRAMQGEQIKDADICMRMPGVAEPRWLKCSAQPIRDDQGHIYAAVAVTSDVTLKRQAQDQLRDSERKFRTLVENLPGVVLRYDCNAQQLYANPAYWLNLDLAGGNILPQHLGGDNLLGPGAEAYLQHLRGVIQTGIGVEFALSWSTYHGTTHTWAMQIVAEHDPSGRIMGVVAIGHDVTALQEAQNSLEESRDQLRALAAAREKSREGERKRIAHEIHDELGQLLTALRMRLSVLRIQLSESAIAFAEPIHQIMELTDNIIRVVRNVAAALRPSVMDTGLISALEWLAQQQTELTGVVCRLQLPASQTFAIDDERATALFRIVQESLTNIVRHAKASEIWIVLVCENQICRLEVRDNGIGFDRARLTRKGLGLVGMNERALMLGGSVDISSSAQGTKILVRFPL